MEEELHYTAEQKMECLKNQIFSTIISGKLLNKADFDDLKRQIPKYSKLKLNLKDILVDYQNINLNTRGKTIKDKVFLNDNCFTFYGTTEFHNRDIDLLVQLFTTVMHELSHVVDYLEVQNSDSKRQVGINNINCLSALLSKYDKESAEYNKIIIFKNAYYYASRSEVFARKSAIIHIQNFFNELVEYRKEHFPDIPEIVEEYDNYMNALEKYNDGEECNIPKLSPDAERYSCAKLVENSFEEKLKEIENRQKISLEISLKDKSNNLDFVKHDFETSLVNYLDEKYCEFDTLSFARLMFFKDFYNPKLAKKLYKLSIKRKEWKTALELSKYDDLKIGQIEKRWLAMNVRKLFENNQKNNQTQNSKSMFIID